MTAVDARWWLLLLVVLAALLSGCAKERELARPVGEGSDAFRKSPCACIELDYDGSGYRWRG